jgi:predicted TPR repeat methyltransferase
VSKDVNSPADDEMRAALAAHKAGRLDEAEAAYRKLLHLRPRDPKPLYYLGLLCFHRGEPEKGIAHLRECLNFAPNHAQAWNTLGSMLMSIGATAEAKHAYRRATEAAPNFGEGWYNLAICLRNEGDVEGAIACFRTGIARQPEYTRSYEALGSLLYEINRHEEAAQLYRDWAAWDPTNPIARHMLAATSQREIPPRATDDYVRTLFDSAAGTFDANLAGLGYRAPELVAGAVAEFSRGELLKSVLDAGCGTGLCGPLLREHCRTLVGVDLSPVMIQHAQQRGAYDELVVAELSAFMQSRPHAFDAIVSADTLVYFGALEEPLAAARQALRDGGLFAFTVEAWNSERGDDYRLGAHGRYMHSDMYVRRCAQTAGFAVREMSVEVLRRECEQDVRGYSVHLIATGA